MKAEIDNALLINCVDADDFYYKWMLIVGRIYNLNRQECKVFAKILSYRNSLKVKIKDNALLDELSTNLVSRERMAKELNMSNQHYRGVIKALCTKGVLSENRLQGKRNIAFYYISSNFIPKVKDNATSSLAFVFKRKNNEKNN